MLKLLFWGVIGYVVYRYFQMKEQIKESRQRDAIHQHQQKRQGDSPSASKRSKNEDGDYIDYEEVK